MSLQVRCVTGEALPKRHAVGTSLIAEAVKAPQDQKGKAVDDDQPADPDAYFPAENRRVAPVLPAQGS